MLAKIEVRNNYGNLVFYPHCPKSKLIAKLAGTKTLTRETLGTAKELGFQFQIIQPAINVQI